MDLKVEIVGPVTVVDLGTEFLDASNSRAFKDRMNEMLEGVKYLLVNLQRVQFIDSSGLAALLTCLKHMSVMGGDMKICCVSSPVKALFDLVKMHRIVEVCRTREDALKAFGVTQ